MSREKQGKILACKFCGEKKYVPLGRMQAYKYCSRKCGALDSRVRTTINCKICGTQFTSLSSQSNPKKYCSKHCYYQSQVGRGLTSYTCQYCEKTFLDSASHKRKYCSKSCVNKANYKVFKPSFTTVRKALITRKMINDCERCGYNKYPAILGVHHKDRNRNNNNLSNLEVLCPMCHSIEHMKHITHGFKE